MSFVGSAPYQLELQGTFPASAPAGTELILQNQDNENNFTVFAEGTEVLQIHQSGNAGANNADLEFVRNKKVERTFYQPFMFRADRDLPGPVYPGLPIGMAGGAWQFRLKASVASNNITKTVILVLSNPPVE